MLRELSGFWRLVPRKLNGFEMPEANQGPDVVRAVNIPVVLAKQASGA